MEQVVPVLVEHILWLMKEEKRALGQLDCDVMMASAVVCLSVSLSVTQQQQGD